MAGSLKTFDSLGGFSIGDVEMLSHDYNARNIHTFELKNQFYTDSKSTRYILRGTNTAILSVNLVGDQIDLPQSSINFITAQIIAVNATNSGTFVAKFENCVTNDASGQVDTISSLETIIRDNIPVGETWTVQPFDDGASNKFSYSTVRGGTTTSIKWLAVVEVVSVAWA